MLDDDVFSDRLRRAGDLVVGREPDPSRAQIQEAIRGGTSRARRSRGLTVAVSAGFVGLLIAALALLQPLGHPSAPVRLAAAPVGSGPVAMSFNGFPGWNSTYRYTSGTLGPALQGSNFKLGGPDFYKSAVVNTPPGGIGFRLQQIDPTCGCAGFVQADQIPLLSRDDLKNWGDVSESAKTFELAGHFFDLYIVIGTTSPSDAMVAEVNGALKAIQVSSQEASVAGTSQQVPAFFEKRAGWNVASSPAPLDGEGYAQTWASTVPMLAADFQLIARQNSTLQTRPDSTIANMPTDGVVITVGSSLDRFYVGRPHVDLPLDLEQFEIHSVWPGYENPDTPEYLLSVWVQDRYLEIRVFFGTQDPTPGQLSEAQAMLDGLTLP